MLKKMILIGVFGVLALSLLGIAACSAKPAAAADSNSVTAKQTTIKASLSGDSVSIPLSQVELVTNSRFEVNSATSTLSFMAYKYNNQIYVRADICPPCGSESFTLTKGALVCDTCGTVFSAASGAGIKGACIKYAKQAVTFKTVDGNMVMNATDLAVAFQNTLRPAK